MHNSKKVIPNSGDVILVTGSNGLIASAVIEHLNMLSIPVLRGVRNSPNSDQDFQVNDLNVHGIEIPENVRTIIHCAGIKKATDEDLAAEDVFQKVNVSFSRELASAAASSGKPIKFIFLSSAAVFGKTDRMVDSLSKLNPDTPYGVSKLEAEKALIDISQNHSNLDLRIVRPPVVFGLINDPGSIGTLSRLVRRRALLPVKCFTEKRSYISVNFLTSFLTALVFSEPLKKTCIYMPASHPAATISELVMILGDRYGVKVRQFCIPSTLFKKVLKLFRLFNLERGLFHQLKYDLQEVEKCQTIVNVFKSSEVVGVESISNKNF